MKRCPELANRKAFILIIFFGIFAFTNSKMFLYSKVESKIFYKWLARKRVNFDWQPSFSCPVMTRVGAGDGGKWVCDVRKLQGDDCIVLSIGSNGNFEFELEILKINPRCKIHTVTTKYTLTQILEQLMKAVINLFHYTS